MIKNFAGARAVSAAALLMAAGCFSSGTSSHHHDPTGTDDADTSAPTQDAGTNDAPKSDASTSSTLTEARVNLTLKSAVDVLFLVDNSPSMTPKQDELRARVPKLLKTFADFGASGNPASYHIGVVTSDLGANGFMDSQKQCVTGGDLYGGGRLQAKGEAAPLTCKPVTGGVKYIDYNQLANESNLPTGQDIGTTFGCMAQVGALGCGYEQQLEASYKALHDASIADNAGFLRANALLAVIYLTDEDDCSAPPDSDVFNATPSTPPPDGLGITASYRCNKWGIVCDDPNTGAPQLMPYDAAASLQNCRPATAAEGSKLYDVNRYVDFFTKSKAQGGIKADPHDVILAAIAADPANGVSTDIANPSMIAADGQATPCSTFGPSCGVVVKHSCVATDNHSFFGDPAVRLKTVVSAAAKHQFSSICDTDYSDAMQGVGDLIVAQLGGACLGAPIANPSAPDCIVTDVLPSGTGGADSKTTIPECDPSAASFPCWSLDTSSKCASVASPLTGDDEQLGVRIHRGSGTIAPTGTYVSISCNTIVVP